MIRVLLIDETCVCRDAMEYLLGQSILGHRLRFVRPDATSPIHAGDERPHVVLVNVATAGGHETIRSILAQDRSTKVIAIGGRDFADDVIACAEAGAIGYLHQSEPLAELVRLIDAVDRGEAPSAVRIAVALRSRAVAQVVQAAPQPVPGRLTRRELQIMQLVDMGLSNKEIARRLSSNALTVKNHIHNVLEKLNVRRRGEAAALLRPLLVRERPAGVL